MARLVVAVLGGAIFAVVMVLAVRSKAAQQLLEEASSPPQPQKERKSKPRVRRATAEA